MRSMEPAPLLSGALQTTEMGEASIGWQCLATALVLEQIGRRADAAAWATGLYPAQWSALRYFARSGAEARTVAAFALSVGASLGTSWQTVKALISKGYVTRHKMPGRGKVLRIDLTAKGRQRIAQDPLLEIAQAVARLDPSLRRALDEAGEILLRDLSPGCAEGEGEGSPAAPQQKSRPSIQPVPAEAAPPLTEKAAADEVVLGFYPRKSLPPPASNL